MGPDGSPAERPHLVASLRTLGATLLGLFHTRAELLSLELDVERTRITRLVMMGAGAFFFLTLGALTFTMLVVIAFWESQRLVVIGFFTAIYLGIAFALVLAARREIDAAKRPFARTLDELRKDREHFLSHH